MKRAAPERRRKAMKIVWLLYQQEDLSANRDYARLMRENGLKRDMKI